MEKYRLFIAKSFYSLGLGKPEKYYVIADSDREKYIERSLLVNMTLLRKTASEKAQTGAILRVVRALLGIKGRYSKVAGQ